MSDFDKTADILSIEQALSRYGYGLDERLWEAWDDVFTEDAILDFTPMGGTRQTPAEMAARLSKPDPKRLFAQHPVTNLVIDIDGDTAIVRSEYIVETGRRAETPGDIILSSGGGSYVDEFVRTPAGWRIRLRKISLKWKETRTVRDEITRPEQ